ncbi:hypothetical protein [Nonomuraea sp. NPDC049480]|uniref:hypothetical protein n=1 Tax=Nonomuraea sp. NPDC049480 TaxID=3364353 RepID=UPI00379484C0
MRKVTFLMTLATIAIGAQLALALPSHADTRVENPTGHISVSANPGKVNNITITPLDPADPGADVIIRDSGDVVKPGRNCVVHGNGVRCNGVVQYIQISLGDMDDFVTNLSTIPVRVTGGEGNDHVNGGAGDTQFRGGPGADTLNGGKGDDVMQAEILADGKDTFIGRGGVDSVDYTSRIGKLSVTLDGSANDGLAGEGDNIAADVEDIFGGKADDTLTAVADAVVHRIDGRAGSDTCAGGAEDVEISCEF